MLDREAVLGFLSTPDRESYYTTAAAPYNNAYKRIANTNEDFGTPRESDLLAVDNKGCLWVIEAKYGDDTDGIQWSPLQVGIYSQAFNNALAEIAPGVNAVIAQKKQYGLISINAPSVIQGKAIKSAILICGKKPGKTAINRMTGTVDNLEGLIVPDRYIFFYRDSILTAVSPGSFYTQLF